jgi:hypothetical protein
VLDLVVCVGYVGARWRSEFHFCHGPWLKMMEA